MGRKIILSRKGFDSGNTDMPSAFVRDGEMVSFPIPASNRADLIRYADIRAEGMSLQERIEQLCQGERTIFPHERCHHDPDLVCCARERPSLEGWTGVLGQSGSAYGHLNAPYGRKSEGVGKGDLFLFFGRFREAEKKPEGLRFVADAPDLHAFFGYLQIGDTLNEEGDNIPECFNDHPHPLRRHLCRDRKRFEAGELYIARKDLELPGIGDSEFRGWGVFHHSEDLVLTASKKEQKRDPEAKVSHTVWNLDKFGEGRIFRGKDITYHTKTEKKPKKNPWLPSGLFKSTDKGQEFIVYDDDGKVSKWAAELIRNHRPRS